MTDDEFDALASEVADAIWEGRTSDVMRLCTGLSDSDGARLHAEMVERRAIVG